MEEVVCSAVATLADRYVVGKIGEEFLTCILVFFDGSGMIILHVGDAPATLCWHTTAGKVWPSFKHTKDGHLRLHSVLLLCFYQHMALDLQKSNIQRLIEKMIW